MDNYGPMRMGAAAQVEGASRERLQVGEDRQGSLCQVDRKVDPEEKGNIHCGIVSQDMTKPSVGCSSPIQVFGPQKHLIKRNSALMVICIMCGQVATTVEFDNDQDEHE